MLILAADIRSERDWFCFYSWRSAHRLSVLRIDHPNRPMPQGDPAASGTRFNLDFHMIVGRIRHEHRAAQFQQAWRLNDLHEPPKVSDSLSSIPVPPPAWFRLQQQLQGLAIRPGVAFPEAVEEGRKCLLDDEAACAFQRGAGCAP